MRIGIVIPAFNAARWLGEAIDSVLAQTVSDWVMTIVDDGSTDATASVAGAVADPRVRLIRQANTGVSTARNRGLAATDAEAILFLDADDWLAPDALARLARALEAAPDAVAAVGPYVRVTETGRRIRVAAPPSGDLLRSLLVRNLFANGGHLLIRRAKLHASGPFDPRLSYGEDWEYWTRLARLGRFVAASGRAPVLFVRERHDGAYQTMAARADAFAPCMCAMFQAPALTARFGAVEMARLRARAEAENDWIIGRELTRHGRAAEGRTFLRRSFAAAPGAKRLVLLALAALPAVPFGPFRRYPLMDRK